MKLAVFDSWRVGIVDDDGKRIRDVTQALPRELDLLPMQRVNWLIANWEEWRARVLECLPQAAEHQLSTVRLRSPSPAPAHVFAAPANYRKHIGELAERAVTRGGRTAREQGFFLKAPASVSGQADGILLPHGSQRRFDHESELAIIVGRPGRNVPRAQAMQHVFGYACLVDLTMRIEPGTGEEERSMRKSFETFTPLGPWIVTADELQHPSGLSNELLVNGQVRQSANTQEMIVGVPELIELISSVLPIAAGDVIATGTPEGVGPVAVGDEVEIRIERIGSMRLAVRQFAQQSPRAY